MQSISLFSVLESLKFSFTNRRNCILLIMLLLCGSFNTKIVFNDLDYNNIYDPTTKAIKKGENGTDIKLNFSKNGKFIKCTLDDPANPDGRLMEWWPDDQSEGFVPGERSAWFYGWLFLRKTDSIIAFYGKQKKPRNTYSMHTTDQEAIPDVGDYVESLIKQSLGSLSDFNKVPYVTFDRKNYLPTFANFSLLNNLFDPLMDLNLIKDYVTGMKNTDIIDLFAQFYTDYMLLTYIPSYFKPKEDLDQTQIIKYFEENNIKIQELLTSEGKSKWNQFDEQNKKLFTEFIISIMKIFQDNFVRGVKGNPSNILRRVFVVNQNEYITDITVLQHKIKMEISEINSTMDWDLIASEEILKSLETQFNEMSLKGIFSYQGEVADEVNTMISLLNSDEDLGEYYDDLELVKINLEDVYFKYGKMLEYYIELNFKIMLLSFVKNNYPAIKDLTKSKDFNKLRKLLFEIGMIMPNFDADSTYLGIMNFKIKFEL